MDHHRMRLGEMLRALNIKTEAVQSELASLRQDVRRLIYLLEQPGSAAPNATDSAADKAQTPD